MVRGIRLSERWRVCFFLLLIPLAAPAAEFSFGTPSSFEVGFYPNWIAVGDVNRDGRDDIVVSHDSSQNLAAVLLSSGAVGFEPATYVTVGSGFNTPTSVCLGDFDEDGQLDLAVTKVNVNNLAILRGDGQGGFGSPVDREIPDGSPESIAATFLDSDSHLDLVFAERGTGTAGLLLGKGDGTFGELVRVQVTAQDDPMPGFSEPMSVAIGDFNLDNNMDLAVAFRVRDYIAVVLGNGLGGFGMPIIIPFADPLGLPADLSSIVTGDLDADGILDLAVVQALHQQVLIFRGDGNGQFALAKVYSAPEWLGNAVASDFNGDGQTDLAWVMGTESGRIVLVPGRAEGPGDMESLLLTPGVTGPYFVAAGDFDGDRAADLVTADRTAKSVSRLINAPANRAPVARVGSDLGALVGEPVSLDGSASFDPDGDLISFSWVLTSKPLGSAASLSDANMPIATLVPDLLGIYNVTLEVSDGYLISESASVGITTLSASEVINAVRTVINALPDAEFKPGARNSFSHVLDDIQNLTVRGSVSAAIKKSQDLRMKVDGCTDVSGMSDRNDWVIDCASQMEIRRYLDGLIRTLGVTN